MTELQLVLALLLAAIVLFAIGKPRMDAVALLMMTVLPLTGIIDVKEALAGFSDPSIVLIAALFVVGDGLARTGVAQRLGDWLLSRAASSETTLIVLLMTVVAGVGAVMSSTAVVAIFLPIALRIARSTGISPGRLMMPLSFAALHSGMMTLIATAPNLVINSELVRHGHEGFHLFGITPFGLPLLAIGIVYMLFARRWIEKPAAAAAATRFRPFLSAWIDKYGLANREHRLRVTATSPMVGKTLQELDLRGASGLNIVAIERSGRFANHVLSPRPNTQIQAGDVLFMDAAREVDMEALRERLALETLPLSGAYFSDQSQEIGMAEVMIPPESKFIGKTIVEARIRSKYGLHVVGLRRGQVSLGKDLLETKLRLGDTLLLAGRWRQIRRMQSHGDELIVLDLPAEYDEVIPAPGRAPHALLALGIMIVLMLTGVVSNVQAALIACLLLGLTGCVDLDSAYRSIHWQSIVLIVGMLPFALALQRTGGVEIASDALLGMAGEAGPRTVLATLFVITVVMGLFISNTATAVLMAPIAMGIADSMDASPYPFAMTVAIAASCAFLTPVSSPVNTLVVGPGNYRFIDFLKVGAPYGVIALVVSVTLIPWLLPL